MKNKNEINYKLLMWLIILVSMIVAVLFCNKKQGFHFDENYSYYSTNITNGLWATDNEWKDVGEIRSEFQVNQGEALNFGLVKTSQTFDVHPPLYYFILRVVCFLTKNTYSKWQGLSINLIFYFGCLILLWKIADLAGNKNKYINAFTLALFGLSPAFISAITFIRMYVMLTMLCFALLLVAMKAFANNSWTWKKCYIPTLILCFMGFLTHYYFIIFAFFVAAYTCLYLVFHKETRIQAFIYGGSICAGIIMAVAYYPACISHIFRGYRGNDATQAFLDVSNTGDRINFFVQMLDDYAISSMFYILVLIIVLIYVFNSYKKKAVKVQDNMEESEENVSEVSKKRPEIGLLIVVAAGYFLLVCKTAIVPSNPAEALRYQSPVYGLIILLVVMGLVVTCRKISSKALISVVILMIAVVFQIVGLTNNKVFFIYDDANIRNEWAKNHKDKDIVYIYNPNNEWMVWNDSTELMEYKDIFFVPYNTETFIEDERLKNSTSVFVYACRSDSSEEIIRNIISSNDNLNMFEKVEERLYVDIYELK